LYGCCQRPFGSAIFPPCQPAVDGDDPIDKTGDGDMGWRPFLYSCALVGSGAQVLVWLINLTLVLKIRKVGFMGVMHDGNYRSTTVERICRGLPAFGKGYKTLGKGFAEGCLRQRAVGKFPVGKGVFAEGLLSGTRQRFCRGLTPAFGEKKMPLGHWL